MVAVHQDVPHQARSRQEGQAEPAIAQLVPPQDRQQDPLQRQAATLAPHQAQHLRGVEICILGPMVYGLQLSFFPFITKTGYHYPSWFTDIIWALFT
jgi:hypothetical protein